GLYLARTRLSYGEWLRRAARGIDEEPVEERLGTEQIGRLVTFPEDTRDMAAISGAFAPLAEDIGRKLAERGLAYRTVTVTFITEEFEAHTRSRTLPAPTRDLVLLGKVARELAAAFLAERSKKLRRIGLRVSDLGPERQRSLLEFG
ncbi:MAG: DNA polymerase IV, partial [Elusimicrobiota bacterium]